MRPQESAIRGKMMINAARVGLEKNTVLDVIKPEYSISKNNDGRLNQLRFVIKKIRLTEKSYSIKNFAVKNLLYKKSCF